MKICQIVASYGTGGLEKHVIDLCNELSRTDEVVLIAPLAIKENLSASVRFIPMNFKRSRYNPLLYLDLLTLLKREQFDIVHAHANKAVSVISKMTYLIPGKVVGTIHNSHAKKGRVFKNVDHVIAVSQEAGCSISKNISATVIYNGIQLNPLLPVFSKQQLIDEFGLQGGKPLLCSVGRLVSAKGFDLLIEAMQGVDANLIILGEGELRSELQAKIDKFRLNDRVILAGHRSDVMSILKGVDGMIISSRNEGFSYVFVEALLSKLPVLSTNVSAKEFLPECLIMSKSVTSIREKMNEYVFSLEHWKEQMQPVFTRAKNELTLEQMAKNTLSVYRSLITNGS